MPVAITLSDNLSDLAFTTYFGTLTFSNQSHSLHDLIENHLGLMIGHILGWPVATQRLKLSFWANIGLGFGSAFQFPFFIIHLLQCESIIPDLGGSWGGGALMVPSLLGGRMDPREVGVDLSGHVTQGEREGGREGGS